jgi:hypothetical protein
MKWTALIAASGGLLGTLALGTPALAAPHKSPAVENSPDVLRPQQARKALARPALAPPLAEGLLTAAAAPTVEEVGDADSFGRNVIYLGMAQTQGVVVQPDCTGSDPTLERCIVANPAPATTTFNESDLASITLPAKASKSLLCFTLTPLVSIGWFNPLATPANARFNANAVITIDNEVLDDPALIDPGTGLPFGGTLTVGLSTFSELHTLQPGETDNKNLFMTRSCIAGIISKRVLVESYGFTEGLAKEFFKKPITLSFGARGSVALADFLSYFYGFRLYGD